MPAAVNHNSVQCDRCNIWVHTKCSKINKQTYKLLQKDKSNWYCIISTKAFLPFSNLNDEEFISTVGKKTPFTAIRKKCQPEQEQFLKTLKGLTENDPTTKLSPYLYPEEMKQHVPTGDNPHKKINRV